MLARKNPRIFTAIVGLLLSVFFLWRLHSAQTPAAFDLLADFDSADYSSIGEALLHGVKSWDGRVSHRLPLSSLMAAFLCNHSGLYWEFLKNDLSFAQVLLVAALGCLLQPFAGLMPVAAVWAHGHFVNQDYPFAELFFSLLIMIVAMLGAWRAQAPSLRRSLLLSVGIGTSLLYRSSLFLLPPLLCLVEWIFPRPEKKAQRRKHFLILALVPYLFLIPWVKMNWAIYQRFVPFEHGGGPDINIVTAALGLVQATGGDWTALAEAPLVADNSGGGLAWAAREILRHPLVYLSGFLERIRFVVSSQPRLFLLALVGMWLCRKRRDFQFLGLLSLYYLYIHCTMSVTDRYFMPLWPVLSVLAASPLIAFLPHKKSRISSRTYLAGELILVGGLSLILPFCLYTLWTVNSYTHIVQTTPEPSLDEQVRRHPKDSWLYWERGGSKLRGGDFASAIEDFSRALALQPGNPQYRLELAWAKNLQGQPNPLLEWQFLPLGVYGNARNNKLNFRAHVYKAWLYLKLGRIVKVREHLNAAREINQPMLSAPTSIETARGRKIMATLRSSDNQFSSEVLVMMEDRPEDERLLFASHMARLYPEFKNILLAEADLAARIGKRNVALASLARAQRLKPNPSELWRMSRLYFILKDYGKAKEILRALLEKNPGNLQLWLDQAEIELQTEDRGGAFQSLAHAESLTLTVDQKRFMAARYSQLKEYGKAKEILKTLLGKNPGNFQLWLDQAEIELQTEDRGGALQSLARAGSLAKSLDERHRLALFYQGIREYKKALSLFLDLTAEFPERANLLHDQGVCHFLSGAAPDEAIKDIRQAIKRDPYFLPGYLSLGAIYMAANQKEEALRIYELAYVRKPTSGSKDMRKALHGAREKALGSPVREGPIRERREGAR